MKHFTATALLLLLAYAANAQEGVLRTWYNQERTGKIQIYKQGDKYFGKIVWLKEPEEDGKPKKDTKNPDASKRDMPVMGLVILKNFSQDPKNDNLLSGGTIYDPKNGKTYSSKMTLKGEHLDVRGYIGISMIGRTETWTPAD